MRAIPLILALLAGCGPGVGAPRSSFAVDSCTPEPATITAIELWHDGMALAAGARAPTDSGGQGLPMASVDVHLTGTFGGCVEVSATAGHVQDGGGLKVADGSLHVFMGPVDPSFDLRVVVHGLTAH